jgi:hypothetical protein
VGGYLCPHFSSVRFPVSDEDSFCGVLPFLSMDRAGGSVDPGVFGLFKVAAFCSDTPYIICFFVC